MLTLPPPPTARVNDYAGVLSAADRARLEQQLTERERATGAQMVIAIFPSLEGESLEDVSIRLAERWKVGRKGVDNGVILLAFLKERKLRIEVGYGLEPVITDAVASAMIRDVIAPRFREGRYAAGLEAAVNEVFARIGAETTTRETARGLSARRAVDPGTMLLLLLIFGVFGVAILNAMRSSLRRGYTVDRRGWSSRPPIFWSGGGGSWGGGGGGGFSGGGGSFGGGGASGDW